MRRQAEATRGVRLGPRGAHRLDDAGLSWSQFLGHADLAERSQAARPTIGTRTTVACVPRAPAGRATPRHPVFERFAALRSYMLNLLPVQ